MHDITQIHDRAFQTLYKVFGFLLTPFRMVLFRAAHGWGEGVQKSSLREICHAYPTIIKLLTVIPVIPKEDQKTI